VRAWLSLIAVIVGGAISVATLAAGVGHPESVPSGQWIAAPTPAWHYTGRTAESRRAEALAHAAVFPDASSPSELAAHASPDLARMHSLECRFVDEAPSGTSPKFHCVLPDGREVRVKYGRNPEIQGEAAATRLLALLGFPSDIVEIVPVVRCYGCPRLPFESAKLRSVAPFVFSWRSTDEAQGYTDFEWPAVERRFPAPPVETDATRGWGWWELKHSTAPRADLDALRLLAVFLAHWDNKTENQRLVCLDDAPFDNQRPCARSLLVVQDLGATFGPYKVNIVRWREAPLWADERRCVVTMRALPFGGGTFPDVRISEEGRQEFLRRIDALSEPTIRQLFQRARFPEFYTATDDERDLTAWAQAFRARVDRIRTAGPCA
jgi:hypothetical protein